MYIENFYYIESARFSMQEKDIVKRDIKSYYQNFSKEAILKFKKNASKIKQGEFFTDKYGLDVNIGNQRVRNFEETTIFETFKDMDARLEKEKNYKKYGIPVVNKEISYYKLLKIAPILCFDSASRLVGKYNRRLSYLEEFNSFNIPLDWEGRSFEGEEYRLDELKKEKKEAEENYIKYGITETNLERKNRLQSEENGLKHWTETLFDEKYSHESDRVKFNFKEFGLACSDSELEKSENKDLEIKNNYETYGLPETDYEKMLREKFIENIDVPNNYDTYKDYFVYTLMGVSEFRKYEWNQKKREYRERKENLKNNNIPESNFEKQFREETEINLETYGVAETNTQRELRDEIAYNMMSYGLSFTNEEIASFNEFTNIIKKNIHKL
jgi:hypothetical protein